MRELAVLIEPLEAENVKRELDRAFGNRHFTPSEVVQIAKHESSPLHKYFEWNDGQAARLYRIEQARKLIQTVTVMVENIEVRAYHSVRITEDGPRQYMPLSQIMEAPNLYQQVLERAGQEALSFKRRYQHLKALEPIIAGINEFERRLKRNAKTQSPAVKRQARRKADQDTRNRVQAR